MPGIVSLVSAISTDVNAALVSNGMPPLSDGSIMIGQVHVAETPAPPRVVFVPRGSRFTVRAAPNRSSTGTAYGRSVNPGSGLRQVVMTQYGGGYTTPQISFTGGGGSNAAAVAILNGPGNSISAIALTNAGSGYTSPPNVVITDTGGTPSVVASAVASLQPSPEKLVQMSSRSLFTDTVLFDVHVWGVTGTSAGLTPSPDTDFDAAQLLYQQVIASTWLITAGMSSPKQGVWVDSRPDKVQLAGLGHYYVFALEIDTPIPEAPYQAATGTLTQAAPGVQASPTLTLMPFAGGTPGTPTTG